MPPLVDTSKQTYFMSIFKSLPSSIADMIRSDLIDSRSFQQELESKPYNPIKYANRELELNVKPFGIALRCIPRGFFFSAVLCYLVTLPQFFQMLYHDMTSSARSVVYPVRALHRRALQHKARADRYTITSLTRMGICCRYIRFYFLCDTILYQTE